MLHIGVMTRLSIAIIHIDKYISRPNGRLSLVEKQEEINASSGNMNGDGEREESNGVQKRIIGFGYRGMFFINGLQ